MLIVTALSGPRIMITISNKQSDWGMNYAPVGSVWDLRHFWTIWHKRNGHCLSKAHPPLEQLMRLKQNMLLGIIDGGTSLFLVISHVMRRFVPETDCETTLRFHLIKGEKKSRIPIPKLWKKPNQYLFIHSCIASQKCNLLFNRFLAIDKTIV